ncbi:MAG: succinate dehydrogenase, hydrophobic membrane anchor protein [Pseudomonadota bacterium]
MRKPVTGSHSGTGWWLAQRFSAVVLLLSGLILWLGYLQAPALDYDTLNAFFQADSIRLLVWLLVASLSLHAWVGLRDVLMDYVKPVSLRLALNLLVTLVLLLCTVWTTAILWGAHG